MSSTIRDALRGVCSLGLPASVVASVVRALPDDALADLARDALGSERGVGAAKLARLPDSQPAPKQPAPKATGRQTRRRGELRDAVLAALPSSTTEAPTKGYMVPTASTRRDDCTRYAECLYVAAKRNGEWGCPRDCEHFVPVSRDQRIAEATIERVSRMGAP